MIISVEFNISGLNFPSTENISYGYDDSELNGVKYYTNNSKSNGTFLEVCIESWSRFHILVESKAAQISLASSGRLTRRTVHIEFKILPVYIYKAFNDFQ